MFFSVNIINESIAKLKTDADRRNIMEFVRVNRILLKAFLLSAFLVFIFCAGCASTLDPQKQDEEESKLSEERADGGQEVTQTPSDEEVMRELDKDLYQKKQRLTRSKTERDGYFELIKKVKTVEDLNLIKTELDRLEGEIESLQDEIQADEMLKANQEKFAIKHFDVYGPVGIVCKLLEIILNRSFILFVF